MNNGSINIMEQFVPETDGLPSTTLTPLSVLDLTQIQRRRRGDNKQVSDLSAMVGAVSSSVLLEELAVTGLLLLRARESISELAAALQSRLSLRLPERLESDGNMNSNFSASASDDSANSLSITAEVNNSGATDSAYCIRWMSPDEWLLSCPADEAFDIENDLRSLISGSVAIVNVCGGFSVLNLSGADARSTLKKSTAYDVDECNFPAGKVVNTMMAKAQITLRSCSTDSYEIIVRRSFADYLSLWLQRAGSEYGIRINITS